MGTTTRGFSQQEVRRWPLLSAVLASLGVKFGFLTARGLGPEIPVDALNRRDQARGGLSDRIGNDVAASIPLENFCQSVVDRQMISRRTGCHVTVDQRVAVFRWFGAEALRELSAEISLICLDESAGVMCDQPAQVVIRMMGIAEVAGAV